MNRALALASLAVLLAACPRPERPDDAVRAFRRSRVEADFPAEARFKERGGPGVLVYRGLTVAEGRALEAGKPATFEHYFEVVTPFTSTPEVFVHVEVGDRRVGIGDHAPVQGEVSFAAMKTGELWLDRHRVQLPADASRGTARVFVGLFSGSHRMTLEAPAGKNDGRDRLEVAQLPMSGRAPADLPLASIRRASGPIEPDGRLDEPSWKDAEVLTLSDSLGRDVETRFPTRARLLYDRENLYLAFEAEDEDISERYSRRDDPIYEHEAVELFVMPHVRTPATGPYVELQASPTGVLFDAAFTGPRQNMDRGFDGGQTVGTQLDGTLNDAEPDRGWVSEWVIPFASLRGVTEAPEPGSEWRMNLFRIEKYRRDGRIEGEYTAWSPPRVGDFHAVDRFGRMRFE